MLRPTLSAIRSGFLPFVIVAALYAVLSMVSTLLAVPPNYASSFWLPAGVGLIAALHWGRVGIAGVWLGAYIGNAWSVVTSFGLEAWLESPIVPAFISVGAAIEAGLSAYLLRRANAWPDAPDGWRLIGTAVWVAGVASLTSMAIGTSTLVVSDTLPSSQALNTAFTWWLGDFCGQLLLLPLAYWPSGELRAHRKQFFTELILPLGLVFLLALSAFGYMLQADRERQSDRLSDEAEHLVEELMSGGRHAVKLVESIAAFLESSSYVSLDEFRMFASEMDQEDHPFQALQWSPLIDSDAALVEYQELLIREGLQALTLKPVPGVMNWQATPTMVPITYLYPLEGNEPALGLDVWSEPRRRGNLQRAISSGEVQSSPPLPIVQLSQKLPSFLLDRVVRMNRPDGIQRGFARGVFTMEHLAHTAVRQSQGRGLYWVIQDSRDSSATLLTYGELPPKARWNLPEQVRRFTIAGQEWQLRVQATPQFTVRNQSLNLWAAQLGSVLIASAWGMFLFGQWVQARKIQVASEQLHLRNSQLIQSQSLFENLAESSPIGIFRTSAQGVLRYSNPAYRQVVEASDASESKQNFDWVHPDDRPEFLRLRAEHRRLGTSFQHSYRTLHPKRGLRWVMVHARALTDPQGDFDGHIGSIIDITPIKRNEEVLSILNEAPSDDVQEFLRYIARGIAKVFNCDIVFIAEYTQVDHSRCRTLAFLLDGEWADPANFDLTHTPCSAVGRQDYLSVPEAVQAAFPLDARLPNLGVQSYAGMALRDAKGNVMGYMGFMNRKPSTDQDQRALLEMFRLRVEAELHSWSNEQQRLILLSELEARVSRRTDELNRAKTVAEQANRAKSDFLAMMSHEIRTPMNSALGLMELVLLSSLSQEQRQLLDTAQDSARALLRLIDDLLDFSKIEAGKLELALEVASLREIVQRMQDLYIESASRKSLDFLVDVDPLLAPAHQVDRLRIRQILANLLSNAIKFTAKGSVSLKVRVVQTEPGQQTVEFTVTDTGIGVSADKLQQLFQPFIQAHGDTSHHFGGTGLGLSISKRLAELMGGSLTMNSRVGVGSTLVLKLSLQIADPMSLKLAQSRRASLRRETADTAAASARDKPRIQVLAVDDHAPTRLLLQMQLRQLGFEAVLAENGEQALEMWQAGQYCIVVTDCNMPKMDGYELAKRIRAVEKDRPMGATTRIIGCTASQSHRDSAQAAPDGAQFMDDFLIKPLELERLAELLGAFIGDESRVEDLTTRPLTAKERALEHLCKLTGDRDSAGQLLQDFLASLEDDFSRLKAAVSDQDAPACHRAIHRMKGAAATLGDAEFESLLRDLQTFAEKADLGAMDGAREKIERFMTPYRVLP